MVQLLQTGKVAPDLVSSKIPALNMALEIDNHELTLALLKAGASPLVKENGQMVLRKMVDEITGNEEIYKLMFSSDEVSLELKTILLNYVLLSLKERVLAHDLAEELKDSDENSAAIRYFILARVLIETGGKPDTELLSNLEKALQEKLPEGKAPNAVLEFKQALGLTEPSPA